MESSDSTARVLPRERTVLCHRAIVPTELAGPRSRCMGHELVVAHVENDSLIADCLPGMRADQLPQGTNTLVETFDQLGAFTSVRSASRRPENRKLALGATAGFVQLSDPLRIVRRPIQGLSRLGFRGLLTGTSGQPRRANQQCHRRVTRHCGQLEAAHRAVLLDPMWSINQPTQVVWRASTAWRPHFRRLLRWRLFAL